MVLGKTIQSPHGSQRKKKLSQPSFYNTGPRSQLDVSKKLFFLLRLEIRQREAEGSDKISVPCRHFFFFFSLPRRRGVKMSTAKLSTVKMSTAKLPTVKMSTAKLPTVKMSTAKLPTGKMLAAKLPTVKMSTAIMPTVKMSTAKLPTVNMYFFLLLTSTIRAV
jgi:uncharacterized protein YjbI with pentapeptide repeats